MPAKKKYSSDSERCSDSGSKHLSDSDCESDKDSGYSYDEVIESYEEMRAGFVTQGPVMSELSDRSKNMIKAEESKWNA
jgi:hypothetical protein